MKIFHIGIRRFCSILIGLVFFTAGMLKLMDPVGAGLMVEEYLKFFHLAWAIGVSRFLGVAMALLETLTGAALMAGVWRKAVAILTSTMMVIFTFITLILLIFNPEMDCGCFGEAIHLSHAATFIKNLILCALCAVAFLPTKEYGATEKKKIVAFTLVAVLVAGFCIYSLNSLPLVDYTEFAPGASLADYGDDINMSEAGNEIKEEVFVIYEKDGKEGAFTLDKLPDSTWTFVRAETKSLSISDYEDSRPVFFIADLQGEYRNELLLEDNVMIISVYDNKKFSEEDLAAAEDFIIRAESAGFKALLVSRAPLYLPDHETFTSDYKKLITLNRSNGGVTWLSDGEIIRKWTASNRPSAEKLEFLQEKSSIEAMVKFVSGNRMKFQGLLLYSAAVLLLL